MLIHSSKLDVMKIIKRNSSIAKELKEKSEELLLLILSLSHNTIYLIAWVIIQYYGQEVIEMFNVAESMNKNLLFCLKFIFAGSTLVLVLFKIWKNLAIAFYQTKKTIQKKKENL